MAEDLDVAGVGVESAAEDGDERGFSAAARAGDEEEFARGDVEVDAVEDGSDDGAVAIGFVEIAYGDGWIHERKTMAGSMRATRRIPMKLAKQMMRVTAAKTKAATSQRMTRGTRPSGRERKKRERMPMPRP